MQKQKMDFTKMREGIDYQRIIAAGRELIVFKGEPPELDHGYLYSGDHNFYGLATPNGEILHRPEWTTIEPNADQVGLNIKNYDFNIVACADYRSGRYNYNFAIVDRYGRQVFKDTELRKNSVKRVKDSQNFFFYPIGDKTYKMIIIKQKPDILEKVTIHSVITHSDKEDSYLMLAWHYKLLDSVYNKAIF